MISLGVCSRSTRASYWAELEEVIAFCLEADGPFGTNDAAESRVWVRVFKAFIWRWVKKGVPIDPEATDAPKGSLQIIIRQLALAIPALSRYHMDCRLWLTQPEARFFRDPRVLNSKGMTSRPWKPTSEAWIPWNLCLHAPGGTPYDEFNKVGLLAEQMA